MNGISGRVLFARIGWMTYYSGPQKGDERPVGGGRYNQENIGHEVYNFNNVGGTLYGYYQPYYRDSIAFEDTTTNLERIDPTTRHGDSLKGVLVILVAPHPNGGQLIVGWYRNAEVFRHFQKPDRRMQREDYNYNITAKTIHSVLLPRPQRRHSVPKGENGMGQANACYVYDGKGNRKTSVWINDAVQYVAQYAGGNLLESPLEDFEQEVANLLETHKASRSGQGFKITPELRKAIEEYAIEKAMRHFRGLQFDVEYVGKTRSYDLLCSKNGQELRVEIKGTQSAGQSVVLTPNEVKNAKQHRTALFILHSIQVDKKWKRQFTLSGGEQTVLNPWCLEQSGTLKPVSYIYELA